MELKHPKGLYLLFFTEMWERFSYYGMRALLVLYLTKKVIDGGLGFDQQQAVLLYGFFTGFVYFTPLIGGWLADKYLGQRKSITIGAIIMMMGEFILASHQSREFLYIGLILIIIGNGFFKPNISVIVGDLYEPKDGRRDSAYTIFYMGVNLGAFFAPLATGALAVLWGERYGFLAAGIGMLIGLIVYNILGNKYLGDIGKKAMASAKQAKMAGKSSMALSKEEKNRSLVIIILVLFCIVFFAGFEQAGGTLTLYTESFINRNIGNFEVPTAWFQSINPLFIVLFGMYFSHLWMKLSAQGRNPAIPLKMGVGLILLGVGFLFMLWAIVLRGGNETDPTIKTHMMFIIMTYFFHTIGELLLSPIGLSMVTKLAPVKLASLFMGVWLLTSFVANIVGGYIPSLFSTFTSFCIFAGAAIACGIVLLFLNKWLLKKAHGNL